MRRGKGGEASERFSVCCAVLLVTHPTRTLQCAVSAFPLSQRQGEASMLCTTYIAFTLLNQVLTLLQATVEEVEGGSRSVVGGQIACGVISGTASHRPPCTLRCRPSSLRDRERLACDTLCSFACTSVIMRTHQAAGIWYMRRRGRRGKHGLRKRVELSQHCHHHCMGIQ